MEQKPSIIRNKALKKHEIDLFYSKSTLENVDSDSRTKSFYVALIRPIQDLNYFYFYFHTVVVKGVEIQKSICPFLSFFRNKSREPQTRPEAIEKSINSAFALSGHTGLSGIVIRDGAFAFFARQLQQPRQQ